MDGWGGREEERKNALRASFLPYTYSKKDSGVTQKKEGGRTRWVRYGPPVNYLCPRNVEEKKYLHADKVLP